jgi:hypothetical protein
MADETNPSERLEQSLQELDEQGELDSERITFKTMSIGGVHLDQLNSALKEVDYDRDPVRITIEPESERADDHHYRIEFEDLEQNDRGRLVPTDLRDRIEGLADEFRVMDCLVPTEVGEAPDVGVNQNGYIVFDVEAEIIEVDGPGREHTEWQVPDRVYELADAYGAEVRDVACYPDGRGWGGPTFAIEVVVE